jgi:DNA-binding transcriptional regulator GbsR (MarR family)
MSKLELTPVMEKYILHWGEMGTRWGVNRTIAQIHALLYLSPEPLHAEDIQDILSVARSNVSNSLKELQSWGLINTVHLLGDRRDHFESKKDLWEIFNIIVSERKRRELDPTLSVLRNCVLDAEQDKKTDPEIKNRIASMTEFLEDLSHWYDEMQKIPQPLRIKIMKLGSKITGMLTRKK